MKKEDTKAQTESLLFREFKNALGERQLSPQWADFVRKMADDTSEKRFFLDCHDLIRLHLLEKKRPLGEVHEKIEGMFEFSPLMRDCPDEQKGRIARRLTDFLDLLGYYIEACHILGVTGKDMKWPDSPAWVFVDSILSALKATGFVYDFKRKFNVLGCMLRMAKIPMASDLIDVLSSCGISNGADERFRIEVVKLLDFFVSIHIVAAYKRRDSREMVNDLLKALILELNLFRDQETEYIDRRLTHARICLLSSCLVGSKDDAIALINRSYSYLLASDNVRDFPTLSLDNPNQVPHQLLHHPVEEVVREHEYERREMNLLMTDGRLRLMPKGLKEADCHAMLPREVKLWKDIQVYLDIKSETREIRQNDIRPFRDLWLDVEHSLDVRRQVGLFKNDEENSETPSLKEGDIVDIVIVRQHDRDKDKFLCVTAKAPQVAGYISVRDIVPYNINADLRHFRSREGNPLVYEARVAAVEEGGYRFEMKDLVKEIMINEPYHSPGDLQKCYVGYLNGKNATAIADSGASVVFTNLSDFPELKRSDLVDCTVVGAAPDPYHFACRIDKIIGRATFDQFNVSDAFAELMRWVNIPNEDIDTMPETEPETIDSSADEIPEFAPIRTPQIHVGEIVLMIDRMAVLADDYLDAYNYLSFARILCLMMRWESQAAYYKGRIEIIGMLFHFANNASIDIEEVKSLEEENADLYRSPYLRDRFLQLQTISFMGKPSHNEDLFRLSRENDSLRELALLVLAYNTTLGSKMQAVSDELRSGIFRLLKLKGKESHLKVYGDGLEDSNVEFKTSLIYPAGDDMSVPNPDKQMEEIMKVLASFINASGGTLYLGVNDSGAGVGLEQDLNSELFYGDKDKYKRTIIDKMALMWGNGVATNAIESIEFDHTNPDKDVLVVKVLPIVEGVAIDRTWWVRVGSTKRSLNSAEYNSYRQTHP